MGRLLAADKCHLASCLTDNLGLINTDQNSEPCLAGIEWHSWPNNNNNNNNNLACIAPVYQKPQRRWRTDYGRENRLGLRVWRNKNGINPCNWSRSSTSSVDVAPKCEENTQSSTKWNAVETINCRFPLKSWAYRIPNGRWDDGALQMSGVRRGDAFVMRGFIHSSSRR